jgi:hypothetical protein
MMQRHREVAWISNLQSSIFEHVDSKLLLVPHINNVPQPGCEINREEGLEPRLQSARALRPRLTQRWSLFSR